MKVKELIEILSKLDQEKEIYLVDNETGTPYDPETDIKYDPKYDGYTL